MYSLSRKAGWSEMVDGRAVERPATLSDKQRQALSDRELLEYNESRAIWHANFGPIVTPQLEETHEILWEILASNRQHGDKVKGAAAIDAYPGLGKSTIASTFGRAFHRQQILRYGDRTERGDERWPVAHIGLTDNTTIRTVNSMLCRFYGHPTEATEYKDSGTAQTLASQALDSVLRCETEIVIVDDVHFLDMTRKDGLAVANHFKWLQNNFPIQFIFVGVALLERGLMSEGSNARDAGLAQTARRWTRLNVDPFGVDSNNGRRDWRRLLLSIEKQLVLEKVTPGCVADDLSDYLYERTQGHVGSVMELIRRGCTRAIRRGDEQLTVEMLDGISIDVAAEKARAEYASALNSGLISTKVTRPRRSRSLAGV